MSNPRQPSLWIAITFFGAGLMILGLAPFGIDFMTMDHTDLLGSNYRIFFLVIAAGLILLLIGPIGWAKQLGSKGRASIGAIVLGAALAIYLLAALMGGGVHGPFLIFVLPMVPLATVGLILLAMAALAKRHEVK